eukprot:30023-Pyramimonas_sp.AAC.1
MQAEGRHEVHSRATGSRLQAEGLQSSAGLGIVLLAESLPTMMVRGAQGAGHEPAVVLNATRGVERGCCHAMARGLCSSRTG